MEIKSKMGCVERQIERGERKFGGKKADEFAQNRGGGSYHVCHRHSINLANLLICFLITE